MRKTGEKEKLKQISEKWFIDGDGNYYLHVGDLRYLYYGKPEKEDFLLAKIWRGELALEPNPITIIDNVKIYHVYNPNVIPIPHFDIVVDTP